MVWLMRRARRFCDRFALVRQQCWLLQRWGFCPKGVGAGLARELARSASKTCERDLADASHTQVLRPLRARSPAMLAPTALGLLPE
ncbi:hypothetical protein, partial [Pseudomonas palmensis]